MKYMNDKQHGGCKMDCQPSDARNCSANGLPDFTKIIHLASIYCKTIYFLRPNLLKIVLVFVL